MENNKLISFSIICLAVSLIISSIIISRGLTDAASNVSSGLTNCGVSINGGLAAFGSTVNASAVSSNEDFMSLYDASTYLHMDEQSLRSLISNSDSGIPYTASGNNIVFSKKALSKWMEDRISKGIGK